MTKASQFSKPFKCLLCNVKYFKTESEVQKHRKYVHKIPRKIPKSKVEILENKKLGMRRLREKQKLEEQKNISASSCVLSATASATATDSCLIRKIYTREDARKRGVYGMVTLFVVFLFVMLLNSYVLTILLTVCDTDCDRGLIGCFVRLGISRIPSIDSFQNRGLFACRDFIKNDKITEYTGSDKIMMEFLQAHNGVPSDRSYAFDFKDTGSPKKFKIGLKNPVIGMGMASFANKGDGKLYINNCKLSISYIQGTRNHC